MSENLFDWSIGHFWECVNSNDFTVLKDLCRLKHPDCFADARKSSLVLELDVLTINAFILEVYREKIMCWRFVKEWAPVEKKDQKISFFKKNLTKVPKIRFSW